MRLAGLAFVSALFASAAHAGQCPVGSERLNTAFEGPRETSGVTVEPLVAYGLAEHYDIADRALRMRRLTVAPGGVIGLHEHSDRPGAAVIISGEMTEYRNTCAVGVAYSAGEAVAENGPLAHWWRNETDAPAVIIVADLYAE